MVIVGRFIVNTGRNR